MRSGPSRGRAARMAYSPLTSMLREARATVDEAESRGMPPDEVAGERSERGLIARSRRQEIRDEERERERSGNLDRRDFLKKAGLAAGGVVLASQSRWAGTRAQAATASRIVIVGGGIAGIRCADRLWNTYGLRSTVFEASNYIGGRLGTTRNFFDFGQIAETHAEFINDNHTQTINLTRALGLTLEDSNAGALPGLASTYWIDGSEYTAANALSNWQTVRSAFVNAEAASTFPQQYNTFTYEGQRLDNMTVGEWFDDPTYPQLQTVGGSSSRFAKLCMTDVMNEYGSDWEAMPVLNLIYELAYNPSSSLEPLSGGNEKWHVKGGNDQLISGMLGRIPADTVKTGTALVALKNNGNGTFTCTFSSCANTFDVIADHVVLTAPFPSLKNVDLSKANLSPRKMLVVNNFELGHNAKINMQFNSRPWAAQGRDGSVYTDPLNFQLVWEASVSQIIGGSAAASPGLLTYFPGGDVHFPAWTGNAVYGPAPAAEVNAFLAQLEPIFPGTTAAYNGKAFRTWPLKNPWCPGAYSVYKLGQWTSIAGNPGVREGNIHFAGEACSLEYQGFLEGAVREANRAADEVSA